ncbi:MAG: hypothetical protein ACRCZF_16350, partial [Gemmataceae bacterium]
HLAAWPLGPDHEAGAFVFASAFQKQRSASAFIVHKPSLQALVVRRKDVFAPLGITTSTPPQEVFERIDRAPSSPRWRAFGLVFGYPEYAVEFFVQAGEQQAKTGKFVERDFRQIPTVDSDHGRFVYAVPKGQAEQPEDIQLKIAAAPVLERFRIWREVYIGEGKSGATALVRDWLAPAHPMPAAVCPQALLATPAPRVTFIAPRSRWRGR